LNSRDILQEQVRFRCITSLVTRLGRRGRRRPAAIYCCRRSREFATDRRIATARPNVASRSTRLNTLRSCNGPMKWSAKRVGSNDVQVLDAMDVGSRADGTVEVDRVDWPHG
jgi:hypothetical protein